MQMSAASRYTREVPLSPSTSNSDIAEAQERRGNRLSDSDLSYGKPRSSMESDSEDRDRRDFTIKATRRPAPNLPTPTFPLTSSASTSLPPEIPFPSFSSPAPLTPSRRGNHQHTSSTSSQHAFIPDPVYPVRNQPIGFQSASRSRSNSSLNQSDSESGSELKRGPSISGGMRPRERNTSFSGSESDHDDGRSESGLGREEGDRENRPLARIRSDSLPVFPPASPIPGELEEFERQRQKREKDLSLLPPNPKNWLPSHLATYLSHTLSTTPTSQTTLALHPLISADITAFIRSSHLSGRSFLRLKDSDLDELGINKKWKPLLSLVREKLRREVLGGKIWGFGSDATIDNNGNQGVEKVEEKVEQEEEGEKENWKKSWRKLSSANSKGGGGRVKGMAQAFESPLPATPSSPTLSSTSSRYSDREGGRGNISFPSMFGESRRSHRRNYSNSSTTSTASIDSGSGHDQFPLGFDKVDEFDSASQLQQYNLQQSNLLNKDDSIDPNITPHRTITNLPDISAEGIDSPSQYQSNISSHSKPYGLVRRPSANNKTATNSIAGSLETTPSKITSRNSRRGITDVSKEGRSTGFSEEESWRGDETLRSPIQQEPSSGPTSNSRKSSKSNSTNNRSALEGLFGLEIPQSTSTIINEAERRRILSEDLEIMTIQIGGGDNADGKGAKGSMVLVRRDQFQDLQRRLAEVETQLADVISSSGTSRATSPISQDYQHSRDGSFASTSNSNNSSNANDSNSPMGWTQLGGYMFAASIGIGIVAGEVIVGKLFGFRRR